MSERLDALQEAKLIIEQQQKMLAQLTEPPFSIGIVIEVLGDEVLLSAGANMMVTQKPPKISIKNGDTVLLNKEAGAIVKVAEIQQIGSQAKYIAPFDKTHSIVTDGLDAKVVFNGGFAKFESGDEVLLDGNKTVILGKMPFEKKNVENKDFSPVKWDEIIGLEDAKTSIFESIINPRKYPAIYKKYQQPTPKGFLFYGPPGCGKTMLCKALATELSGTEVEFISVKGPEILNQFVGVSEATIRSLFSRANSHYEKTKSPAIIFIDEADAIMGTRGSGISSDMEKTIVPTFLTEMDGMVQSDVVVILATNRPDTLDPAVVRDGRIDIKLEIGRPSKEAVAEILHFNLKKVPTTIPVKQLCKDASSKIFDGGVTIGRYSLSNVINGAMAVSIATKAKNIAIRREIQGESPSGLTMADVDYAIDSICRENLNIAH